MILKSSIDIQTDKHMNEQIRKCIDHKRNTHLYLNTKNDYEIYLNICFH